MIETTMSTYVLISIPKSVRDKMDITRCQVLPGVRLEKISSYKLRLIDKYESSVPTPAYFKPTHAVNIDDREYIENLANRLRSEGCSEDIIKDRLHVDPKASGLFDPGMIANITKCIIMSLVITQPCHIDIGNAYLFRIAKNRSGHTNRCSGAMRMSVPLGSNVFPTLSTSAIYQELAPRVNRNNIRRLASILEEYYRSIYWRSDRIAVALNGFWTALRLTDLAQLFLSMTIVLEALLSTSNQEVTHQIAERAAILLAKNGTERCNIYKKIKKLYGVRSKIVHGNAISKKRKFMTRESLIISAKLSSVPVSEIKALIGIASKLLRTVLHNQSLVSIMQTRKNEKLNDFFLELLFR